MSKKLKNRIAEYRTLPTNEKGLEEQRTELMLELNSILEGAKAETRAISEAESIRFDEIKGKVGAIDKTLRAIEEERTLQKNIPSEKEKNKEQRVIDEENFLKFVKGETRALDIANNGGIVPTTIANKIIEKVKELSPIYAMTTIYNVSGDLVFPVYDEESSSIRAAYIDDLTELTEGTGKFTTIKLENFIAGVLAKISKSLMNRTDFDLVGFIVKKVATAIAEFLEKELIIGTTGKAQGLSSTTNIVTAASASAIVADELIDLQMKVPQVYQANACWIMHKNTFKAIRKLKDSNGDYLLNKDANMSFGWELLGKSVYVTESAPEIGAGKKTIFYGDMSGLYVKLAQNVEIQVLLEKYATQHAIGVVGYVEFDSDIVEKQKIAALQQAA